jgi:uncharacterized Fe-S center protein
MKSDVYFIKATSADAKERGAALKKLLYAVKPFAAYRKDEFIPVKVTLGDAACVYNLSPDLVRTVISEIKKQGSKPFLFDTSVIYTGRRQNAVDHLCLAQDKGFSYAGSGAPFIIADGLFGQDGKEFSINAPSIKKIRVPSFVGMVDSLVVLSHATGHIVSGYAGAVKNVAMGMACRPTKQVQHSSLKPSVIEKKCTACGGCIATCPVKAIAFRGEKAFIDPQVCIGCGECLCACKFDALFINWHEDPHVFCERMVEVAACILAKFKRTFFVTFAFDITKECDCISAKNEPMIAAHVGILASADPVSLDKATTDLAVQHKKTELLSETRDIYEAMYAYAEKKGLGNTEYNLVQI